MSLVDIKTFYDLLGHKKQTEIRAIELSKDFKTSRVKGHYFVSSEKEFISKVQELNGKYNLYAGLNERTAQGTEATDVISVKRIFVDIDCITKPATAEDLKEAEKITDEIISVIEKQTGLRAIKIYSGNGFQLVYCIPEIEITEANREEVQAQVQQFLKDLIKKYSNDKVKLDNVGDLPRIIRITGTTNIKGGKISEFIEVHKEENQKLRDYILSLKPETSSFSNIKIGELETSLKEILDEDENIKNLFEGNVILEKYPEEFPINKDLDKSDLLKFLSPSEAELSLVCRLIQIGLDKEQIFKIMASCKLGDWQKKNIQYRELTYKKALERISTEKKENPQRNINELKKYQDLPIIKETAINIIRPIFEGVEKISLSPFQINKLYKIYEANFGIGHSNIFIIASPKENLNYGNQSTRLTPIDFKTLFQVYCKEKMNLLPKESCIFSEAEVKEYGMEKVPDSALGIILNRKQIYEKAFKEKKNQPFFFESILPITTSNLIKAIKNFGFRRLLEDFFYENGKIDKKLEYVFRIGMLSFGNECNPEFSKYNDNKLLITNTKTGKTTQLSKQTKMKFDSAKSSNLLGFATSEKIIEGSLNNQYRQVVLDDFASANYEKEILDNLPSILENGKALIGKGKKSILTECSSSFVLTTNSQNINEIKELVLEFIKILNRLSETPQRIGSRFACIIFGNKFEEAETNIFRLDKKDLQINKFIVEQIFEQMSSFLLKLTQQRKVEEFLEQKNEDYKKLLENITKNEQNFYGQLKEFWLSLVAGYRHHRGFALKQGILDFFLENEERLIQLIKEEFDLSEENINEIIQLSEENLQRLNDLNRESLTNIIQAQKSEAEYLQFRFDNLKQEYLKALIKAVFKLIKDKPDEKENLIPLALLNSYLDKESLYSNQAKIVQKLPKDFTRINKDLGIFGIEILLQQEEICIQFHKSSLDIVFKLNYERKE